MASTRTSTIFYRGSASSPEKPVKVLVRCAAPELEELLRVMFRRYPDAEWATFAHFGWRDCNGTLVLTLSSLLLPREGELDESVGHVAIQAPYSLRCALATEVSVLATGVIHSHPEDCPPLPSAVDDDMDAYYQDFFASFAPGRPYVSLIVSRVNQELAVSGRVFWKGGWTRVERFTLECTPATTWPLPSSTNAARGTRRRTARLSAAFGTEAEARLRRASVAVIGAGGTGSAAIEVLARAGVGHIVVVDPDTLEESNLERIHGSTAGHLGAPISKVALAKQHVRSIDSTCVVTAIEGALPQREVVDALVTVDVALGCTDQQHSRLALSDLATRYLVPSIDTGVLLEGGDGRVSGQIVQLLRLLAADPCVLCRQMTTPVRVSQELMSPDERSSRKLAAQEARERGERPDPYWNELPQLNTVGYLTTVAGSLAAGYAIGWITGRFQPPFSRLQMNLVAPWFDVTDQDKPARAECVCRRIRGFADQASADAFVSAPWHWPAARFVVDC